jgi:hypothetical protein
VLLYGVLQFPTRVGAARISKSASAPAAAPAASEGGRAPPPRAAGTAAPHSVTGALVRRWKVAFWARPAAPIRGETQVNARKRKLAFTRAGGPVSAQTPRRGEISCRAIGRKPPGAGLVPLQKRQSFCSCFFSDAVVLLRRRQSNVRRRMKERFYGTVCLSRLFFGGSPVYRPELLLWPSGRRPPRPS